MIAAHAEILPHILVLAHAHLRQVRGQHASEQVAEALDLGDDPEQVVVHVAEVRVDVLVDELGWPRASRSTGLTSGATASCSSSTSRLSL